MDRRKFFSLSAAVGAASLASRTVDASSNEPAGVEKFAVLTDVTQCIGCRKCEWACNLANHLPTQTLESFETKNIFDLHRRPDSDHYTVVNQYSPPEGQEKPLWVKFQCLHCEHPACYSACLVSAFSKNDNGAVVYDADRCMGCRYCMVACPFQIPAYEYDDPFAPRVQKCNLCYTRILDGQAPACVEICPPQCLTFGKREEVLALAKNLVESNPDQYIPHIYGEHEAGGTSWFYIANKPFDQIGLARVGFDAPPELTETIQHGVFKNFFPPLALFATLGTVMKIFRRENEGEEPESLHSHEPVQHSFFTPGVYGLLALIGIGLIIAFWRFLSGLGAVTNLNDQYPWGIWIAIDVATGVALAAGGFTTAALVHIFHVKRYEPVVRSALLTAVLGYTFVVLGLMMDLGRYYNIWHPLLPSMWSGHSVLFEVGMCVVFYLNVLYIEFIPIVVERFKGRVDLPGRFSRFNATLETILYSADITLSRVMFFFIIAGVVLSCLHQSSLGALMLISPSKMHPLWFTPILPLLFLLSAIMVGYPMVVVESILASKAFGRKPEMDVLTPLSRFVPILLFIYGAFKICDLEIRGATNLLWGNNLQALSFGVEIILGVLIPFIMLCFEKVRRHPAWLFLSALSIVLGVALNRINVFIIAYKPYYSVEPYIPSLAEIAVTVSLISGLVLLYRLAVTFLPVLPKVERESISMKHKSHLS